MPARKPNPRASSAKPRAKAGLSAPTGTRPVLSRSGPGLRRTPVQKRALDSVNRILETTGLLLEEYDLDQVTTDLIAERAGVNIATLYQYFPNKHSIYVELFRRQSDSRKSALEGLLKAIDDGGDWHRALDKAIDEVAAIRRAQPGNLALRLSIRASPILRKVEYAYRDQGGRALAARIERAGRVRPVQARLAGRLAFEVTAAVLDYWNEVPMSLSDAVLQEAKRALAGFLDQYLRPPG